MTPIPQFCHVPIDELFATESNTVVKYKHFFIRVNDCACRFQSNGLARRGTVARGEFILTYCTLDTAPRI